MPKKKEKAKPERKQLPVWVYLLYVLLAILVVVVVFMPLQQTSVHCSVRGIEYVRLEDGVKCWNSDISAKYCPLPTDIECEASAQYSLFDMLLVI